MTKCVLKSNVNDALNNTRLLKVISHVLKRPLLDCSSDGARGVRGAIAPGRQRGGAPKEGGKNLLLLLIPVKGASEA
jgi:hypothetical protein